MKDVSKMSVKELALEEIKVEKSKEAVKQLKRLYTQLDDAKLIVRNLEREIDDYMDELDA